MKNFQRFLPFLVILVMAGLYFYFSLKTNTFFSLDDFTLLANFRDANVVTPLSYLVSGDPWGFHKNLGYLVFFWLFKLFGTNPLPFQFTLFLIHTTNLIVLYFISLRLIKRPFVSLLSTLILNTQYLYYFSNIHEYLTTFFSLFTILIYLQFPKRKLLILTLAFLAILSKEVGAVSLLAICLLAITKKNRRDIMQFSILFVAAALLLWLPQFIARQTPQYYQVSTSVGHLYRNLLSYYPYLLGLMVLVISLVKKSWTALVFLFMSVLALAPALFLSNRHESYYLYLPYAYLGISVIFVTPRIFALRIIYFLLVIYFLGGRQAFPPIAKQEYPNWQKHSINEVVGKITSSIGAGSANLGSVNIQRDAQIMLESKTTDLFFPSDYRDKYQIDYDKEVKIVNITKRILK